MLKESVLKESVLIIRSLSGVTLLRKIFTAPVQYIDFSAFEQGTYLLTWQNASGTTTKRIIKR